MNRLAPLNVSAPAENAGRIPFAFGRRFFLLLFIGLIWIAPAWKQPRFLYVMAAWDVLVLAIWAWDLLRLPRPAQLEVSRIWKEPLGLTQKSQPSIEVRNSSNVAISAQISDEAPTSFSRALPTAQLAVPAAAAANISYIIEPRARGDAKFGDVWLRYSSPLRVAEKWARAPLAQTVRVFPSLDPSGQNAHLPDPQPPDRTRKAPQAPARTRPRIREPARISRRRRISRQSPGAPQPAAEN